MVLSLAFCSGCATQHSASVTQSTKALASAKQVRPCNLNQAYFDGLHGKPASTVCSAAVQDRYLAAWEQGVTRAQQDNQNYIRKAQALLLQARGNLQAATNDTQRQDAERLANNMRTRIAVLSARNEKMQSLRLSARGKPPMASQLRTADAQ
jgi:serine/threonine protein phosphatase PrpC